MVRMSEYLILLGIVCKPNNISTGDRRGLYRMERGLFKQTKQTTNWQTSLKLEIRSQS